MMAKSADSSEKQPTGRSSALWQLTLARLREFYRQPEAVFWVYFFPVLMVIALGIAFRNKPVERITVDIQNSSQSTQILDSVASDERVIAAVFQEDECRRRLRTGKSDLYLKSNDTSGVEYLYDPARPGSVVAKDLVDDLIQQSAGRVDPVATTLTEFEEPGGRYIDFLVPGLLGMSLMGGGLYGVGFAIVDMRIRKLLKRFMATPMRRSDFLIGVMSSRLVYMIPQIFILLIFARYVFNVHIYGNWLAIGVLILLGAMMFSGIGLLVGSRSKTMESVSGLMNLVMLPMWTLCGIFFSYERFPEFVQPAIKLLPLTPLIDSLRAVMLEGAGLFSQWPEMLVMSIWCVATFVIALTIFRWSD